MCDALIIIGTVEKCKYMGRATIRLFFSYPAESLGAIQPELPRIAVVPYSSDVLCVHKSRLQLLYMDVQQLKMVQMVSQPPMILRLVSIWSDAFACSRDKDCCSF